ncbi:hypothetical protein D3C84_312780 [compost metagenome]
MRRMRAVGLVLVDERRGGVAVLVNVVGGAEHAIRPRLVGGAGEHHEVGRAARHEQRVIRLQRDEHRAATTLGHQIQAMVEELAEEGHPRVERCGKAFVRRHVGDEKHFFIVGGAEDAIQAGTGNSCRALGQGCRRGGDRRRVIGSLVDDQVTDDARLRVLHETAGLLI